jgi:phosphotransferase system HPr (HPr) family protein
MTNTKKKVPAMVTADVTIKAERGLSPLLARQIRDAVHGFACTVTIHNARGMAADARNLLQLLLLGAKAGERLTVRCVGPDAQGAHDALVGAVEAEGGPS